MHPRCTLRGTWRINLIKIVAIIISVILVRYFGHLELLTVVLVISVSSYLTTIAPLWTTALARETIGNLSFIFIKLIRFFGSFLFFIMVHIIMTLWGFSLYTSRSTSKKQVDSSQEFMIWIFTYIFIPIVVIFSLFIIGLSIFHIYLRFV